jgi:hypothetical protein
VCAAETSAGQAQMVLQMRHFRREKEQELAPWWHGRGVTGDGTMAQFGSDEETLRERRDCACR